MAQRKKVKGPRLAGVLCLSPVLSAAGLKSPIGLIFSENLPEHAHHLAQGCISLYRLQQRWHQIIRVPGRLFQGSKLLGHLPVVAAPGHTVTKGACEIELKEGDRIAILVELAEPYEGPIEISLSLKEENNNEAQG